MELLHFHAGYVYWGTINNNTEYIFEMGNSVASCRLLSTNKLCLCPAYSMQENSRKRFLSHHFSLYPRFPQGFHETSWITGDLSCHLSVAWQTTPASYILAHIISLDWIDFLIFCTKEGWHDAHHEREMCKWVCWSCSAFSNSIFSQTECFLFCQ